MLADESVVVVGHTRGDWSEAGVHAGAEDFAALKLAANGTLLWKWQVGYLLKFCWGKVHVFECFKPAAELALVLRAPTDRDSPAVQNRAT